MAAASGIWNHAMTAANPLTNAKPMSSASDSGGNSGDASTISANDFLTLLVTEMKNQDPTANTDPNEYINQLVQVNSLEQLIDINQNLSTALGDPSAGTSNSPTGRAVSSPQALGVKPAPAGVHQQTVGATAADSKLVAASHHVQARMASGNLSVPGATPAAHRVAQALSGRN